MSSKRLRMILLGLLALSVVVFLALTVVGLSKLGQKSQKMVDLKKQNQTADAQIANLAKAKREIDKYRFFNDIAKSVIPADKDQAQALSDIFAIANQSGVLIQNVTFPSSSLGLSALPQPTGGTTSGTNAQPSSNAATATPQKVISQAKPVAGIAGLYAIELTISPQTGTTVPASQQVTYPKFLDFLTRIEHNRRTAQVTQVSIQPLGNQFINFTLSTNIFIKP
jgi:hypothetical protein